MGANPATVHRFSLLFRCPRPPDGDAQRGGAAPAAALPQHPRSVPRRDAPETARERLGVQPEGPFRSARDIRRGPGGGEEVERESRECVVVGLDAAAPPGDRLRVQRPQPP